MVERDIKQKNAEVKVTRLRMGPGDCVARPPHMVMNAGLGTKIWGGVNGEILLTCPSPSFASWHEVASAPRQKYIF